MNRLVPESWPYVHTIEGPDDMPAHIKASLLSCSLTIPVQRGQLALGTWQGIYLCEHRDRATSRELVLTLHGQPGEEDGLHRGHPARALRLEDRQLRTGLHADARGGQGIQVELELRWHRPHVARRLHHPLPLPRQDQGGLRQKPEALEPHARRLLPRRDQEIPERLAQHRRHRRQILC